MDSVGRPSNTIQTALLKHKLIQIRAVSGSTTLQLQSCRFLGIETGNQNVRQLSFLFPREKKNILRNAYCGGTWCQFLDKLSYHLDKQMIQSTCAGRIVIYLKHVWRFIYYGLKQPQVRHQHCKYHYSRLFDNHPSKRDPVCIFQTDQRTATRW